MAKEYQRIEEASIRLLSPSPSLLLALSVLKLYPKINIQPPAPLLAPETTCPGYSESTFRNQYSVTQRHSPAPVRLAQGRAKITT